MKNIFPILLLICAFSTSADEYQSFHFGHKDWEIACDNTRTCRAAGYQGDEDELTLSVLLTRKAGPTPVKAELMIGDTLDELVPDAVEMKINQKSYGIIKINANNITPLSPSQRDALLAALPKSSQIEFIQNKKIWRLSDSGATAVLLKMDEAQGRLDTPGALVRKGKRSEENLPAEIAAPLIVKAPTFVTEELNLSPETLAAIEQSLDTTGCDYEDADESLVVYPVTDKYWLASRPCWFGAYNSGASYWLIKSTAPYDPLLITDSGSGYDKGAISEFHKGRGLGDCWSYKSWVWNGDTFVVSEISTTGMCKMIAAGGAWNLPTFVSNLREASSIKK